MDVDLIGKFFSHYGGSESAVNLLGPSFGLEFHTRHALLDRDVQGTQTHSSGSDASNVPSPDSEIVEKRVLSIVLLMIQLPTDDGKKCLRVHFGKPIKDQAR